MHLEEYNKIIDFRKSNPLPKDQYGEKHHIVPKSICPILKNSSENIVRLSAQEHFLAHYHLWHAYRYELHEKKWANKMCFAFIGMKKLLTKSNDIEIMSKLYEEARIALSDSLKGENNVSYWRGKHLSLETRKKMSAARKGKHFSLEARKRMSEARKGKPVPWKGKHLSEEHRQKISNSCSGRYHWYNNGTISCKAKSCPKGFVAGRLGSKK